MQATMAHKAAVAGWPIPFRFAAYAGHALAAATTILAAISLSWSGEYIAVGVFCGPVLAASLVAVILPTRYGRWGNIAGFVLGVVLLALIGPAIPSALENPDSFFDFAPIVAGVTAGVLLVSSAGARTLRRDIDSVFAPVAVAAVMVVVVATGASAIATVAGRETVSDADRAGAIEFEMKDVDFPTPEVVVASGQPVRIVVENDDPVVHTFTVKETSTDVKVKPGSSKLVEFTAPAAGTYQIVCDIPGHGSMKSTLIVR